MRTKEEIKEALESGESITTAELIILAGVRQPTVSHWLKQGAGYLREHTQNVIGIPLTFVRGHTKASKVFFKKASDIEDIEQEKKEYRIGGDIQSIMNGETQEIGGSELAELKKNVETLQKMMTFPFSAPAAPVNPQAGDEILAKAIGKLNACMEAIEQKLDRSQISGVPVAGVPAAPFAVMEGVKIFTELFKTFKEMQHDAEERESKRYEQLYRLMNANHNDDEEEEEESEPVKKSKSDKIQEVIELFPAIMSAVEKAGKAGVGGVTCP